MLREKLKALIKERSLKIADEPVFKLSSGKLSRYYVDLKQITLDPEGAYMVGKLMYQLLLPFGPDGVGGLTLGADPIAYAVAFVSYMDGRPIRPFVVRKEPKAHGTGKQVEGLLKEGDRVAVVEDVVTTASSSLRAVEACRREGLDVIGVFAVVDREEGGRERIKEEGLELYSLFTLSELIS
ncbi:orotate phosphoribosyltransferase [Thermocrinis albus DSM 14484]|uniref:Orotate phosphoribosyltransferase n=1 Tax=Thermocrinis albus (strain DSM 14484 / JCM 11386 / HI 11/12) TaxID=638303 RepID=D3SMX5_THEAH|nr:orotate phosphoribosyltransferase [Thermocrinis albus]ADC90105.1 orotate phosphoribosyltransferase [Thermocrinis albus DSM 14484]